MSNLASFDSRTSVRALLAGSLSVLHLAAAGQVSAGEFDGIWSTRIDCPSNTEDSGAKGYRFEFAANVRDGYISGSYGEDGTPGFLKIEGPIAAGGDAELRARGNTANRDYAVRKPPPGTPYSYRIKAHFEGINGTGTRLEARTCHFTFTKQSPAAGTSSTPP